VAEGHDWQWGKLQVPRGPHGLGNAFDSAPPATGPQALFAEDEAPGDLATDDRHKPLSARLLIRPGHPIRGGNTAISEMQAQLSGMLLHMPHVVELQLRVADHHTTPRKFIRLGRFFICQIREYRPALAAALIEIGGAVNSPGKA
jgi:hypothetical protein